jgi:P27 family predicted phage terminase small subunit
MAKNPALKIVTKASRTVNNPTRNLGKHGLNLWQRVTSEYNVSDVSGREILTLACQALDRAESCRAIIDEEGEVITMRSGGVRDHPALRHEIQNRQFVVKALVRLGLDVEPLRAGPGRPPKTHHWTPPLDEEA